MKITKHHIKKRRLNELIEWVGNRSNHVIPVYGAFEDLEKALLELKQRRAEDLAREAASEAAN